MTIENIYRNRTMNEITEGDVGQTLKVAGWVENIRDHGGVSFIDLRDMYGVLQVVMRDTSLLDGILRVSLSTEMRRHTTQRSLQVLSSLRRRL